MVVLTKLDDQLFFYGGATYIYIYIMQTSESVMLSTRLIFEGDVNIITFLIFLRPFIGYLSKPVLTMDFQ